MAKGLDRHQERLYALHALGRPLARRAGSRCELCEERGERKVPWEVPPLPEEPELESTLLLCEACLTGASGGRLEAEAWRHLETAMWSENTAAKVIAIRMLRRLAQDGVHWARAALDNAYLEPAESEWVDQG